MAPQVEVMCIYGADVPTIDVMLYEKQEDLPNGVPKTIEGTGDGVVNGKSLRGCKRFGEMQTQKFSEKTFPLLSHTEILNAKEFQDFLKDYLKSL